MKIWIKSQNRKNLIACDEISTLNTLDGANLYGNGVLLGKYDTEERALAIIDKIQKFIMNGCSFDDMYGSRRVSKCNIFIMPEE